MTPPSIKPDRIYRTPDQRFANLPDFAYTPQYKHFGNLRYAFLDLVGPVIDLQTGENVQDESNIQQDVQTETILCLHGEPSWSFLYRKMIPGFLNHSEKRPQRSNEKRYIRKRVVAPDFIGFGRSDKPIDDEYYTWDSHREWLINFVQQHIVLDPRTAQGGRVTLVVQDWGGVLGLLLPNQFPSLFTHLIVMNTGLGMGKLPSKGWVAFRDYVAKTPDLDIGALIGRGTPLSKEEIDAYRAPFDGHQSKAGARRFPQLVPVEPSMRGVPESIAALTYYRSLPAIAYSSNGLQAPFAPQSQGEDGAGLGTPLQVFVCVGKADPVLGEGIMKALASKCFGESTGYWWHVIDDGGHFVQEWAKHVPALSDIAWSRKPSGSVEYEGWKATWIPPQSKGKL